MRTPPENAQLALLLEVTATPKPGNVDRHRDYPDLRFEHFVAGAVGAAEGLRLAAGCPDEGVGADEGVGGDEDERVDVGIGAAFERAVAGMSQQRGGNTQFGALLTIVPLVRAASRGELSPEGAQAVVEGTTVADAADVYRAFEHVDVTVRDLPEGMDAPDVRHGGDAVPALEERGLSLSDVMAEAAPVDGVAAEWTRGFPRTFEAARWLVDGDESVPVPDRTARAFLRLLAERVDTFVIDQHDESTAREATRRARAALDGEEDPEALAEEFVDRDINPGTTADLTAGALFVALERGLTV